LRTTLQTLAAQKRKGELDFHGSLRTAAKNSFFEFTHTTSPASI
jgi:hypothetical protein